MTWIKNVDDAYAALGGQIEVLKKKADEAFPKPMEVETLPKAASSKFTSSYNWKIDGRLWASTREPNTVEEVQHLLKQANELYAKDLENMKVVHEANLGAIENNLKIHEKVTLLMRDTLGIPSSYTTSEYKTSRSKNKTTIKHTAGYFGDLTRNIKTSDSYDYTISQMKSYPSTFSRIADQFIANINKEKAEKEKEEKAKKSVQALARMQVKYGLDEDSNWTDVLEALDSKCKYFALARALEDQRGDWSEGFDRVQYAVDSFVVETPEDQEIFDSLHELAYDEDLCDGRTFRDCEWNYSVLYGKADTEVLKDYNALQEYYSKW
tara:strand:+ start:22677 stop:23645 length:969 start_codon:yes stop_codon:yes gene_type:complete